MGWRRRARTAEVRDARLPFFSILIFRSQPGWSWSAVPARRSARATALGLNPSASGDRWAAKGLSGLRT